MSKDLKGANPKLAKVPEAVGQVFAHISDPQNRSLFSAARAVRAFAHVQLDRPNRQEQPAVKAQAGAPD